MTYITRALHLNNLKIRSFVYKGYVLTRFFEAQIVRTMNSCVNYKEMSTRRNNTGRMLVSHIVAFLHNATIEYSSESVCKNTTLAQARKLILCKYTDTNIQI